LISPLTNSVAKGIFEEDEIEFRGPASDKRLAGIKPTTRIAVLTLSIDEAKQRLNDHDVSWCQDSKDWFNVWTGIEWVKGFIPYYY
jgi:hypothetical protein